METLVVLRGISGAGKSTFTKMLRDIEPSLVHASADFVHMDNEGNYKFDHTKLGEGHGQSFRTVIHALQDRAKLVVVDNTNTRQIEMAPYILAGQAFGYKTAIVYLEIDTATALARNIHGVPQKSLDSMAKRWQDPMPFWPAEHSFKNPTPEEVFNFYEELTR